ncbi:hypothetical protein K456DRAFT_35139 [Colletotrichum gloeosporioides 23]|nr:hypothetical protein K456DRAFT_35139 [Colletotrichum gloeosporioides 23]
MAASTFRLTKKKAGWQVDAARETRPALRDEGKRQHAADGTRCSNQACRLTRGLQKSAASVAKRPGWKVPETEQAGEVEHLQERAQGSDREAMLETPTRQPQMAATDAATNGRERSGQRQQQQAGAGHLSRARAGRNGNGQAPRRKCGYRVHLVIDGEVVGASSSTATTTNNNSNTVGLGAPSRHSPDSNSIHSHNDALLQSPVSSAAAPFLLSSASLRSPTPPPPPTRRDCLLQQPAADTHFIRNLLPLHGLPCLFYRKLSCHPDAFPAISPWPPVHFPRYRYRYRAFCLPTYLHHYGASPLPTKHDIGSRSDEAPCLRHKQLSAVRLEHGRRYSARLKAVRSISATQAFNFQALVGFLQYDLESWNDEYQRLLRTLFGSSLPPLSQF